jgi:hypothetical protein
MIPGSSWGLIVSLRPCRYSGHLNWAELHSRNMETKYGIKILRSGSIDIDGDHRMNKELPGNSLFIYTQRKLTVKRGFIIIFFLAVF